MDVGADVQDRAVRSYPVLWPDEGRTQGQKTTREVLVDQVDRHVHVLPGVRGAYLVLERVSECTDKWWDGLVQRAGGKGHQG